MTCKSYRLQGIFDPDVAVRVICWFPPDDKAVVVVMLGGDKGKMGDVFYSSVPVRANALIEQWQREMSSEEES
jgi:hypothetical protein